MAFIVSTDRDGIHSIGTSSATAERWPGKVLDLGRLRFDADRLLARFEQAGMADLAAVVRDARAHEQLVAGDPI
jgi:hypothetical protein